MGLAYPFVQTGSDHPCDNDRDTVVLTQQPLDRFRVSFEAL